MELFSEPRDNASQKTVSRSVLSRIWSSYEKVILITIAFLITAIVSFSVGVEKGKNITAQKNNLRINVAALKTAPVSDSKQPAPTAQQNLESYTIQLASFTNKILAQKEIELLRKKGYAPLLAVKGKYTVLYVGNFSDKETANKVLGEFKKRYSSCRIIRRL